jgi:hypothetical protein
MNMESPAGTAERDEKYVQSLAGIPEGKDIFEDLHVDGRIILR